MSRDKIIYSGEWQVIIPKSFLLDNRLSCQEKTLYMILKSYVSESNPNPFPSISTLCNAMNISNETLNKYMKLLIKKKLINRELIKNEKGQFSHYIYTVFEYKKHSNKVQTRKKPQREKTSTVKLGTNVNQVRKNGNQKESNRTNNVVTNTTNVKKQHNETNPIHSILNEKELKIVEKLSCILETIDLKKLKKNWLERFSLNVIEESIKIVENNYSHLDIEGKRKILGKACMENWTYKKNKEQKEKDEEAEYIESIKEKYRKIEEEQKAYFESLKKKVAK